MKIRALSVFESVVYHCYAVNVDNPCRPTLEVDARTGPGDLDAGPLLVTWGDYVRMAGVERAEACISELRRRNRLVTHLGVTHLAFPTWTPADDG